MFWWILIIGMVVPVGVIVVEENRRSSTGEHRKDDRHLNRRDPRGDGPGERTV